MKPKLLITYIEKIKGWYKGKYTKPIEYNPNSGITIVHGSYYKQPRLVVILKAIGTFLSNHWKWVITIIVSIVVAFLIQ